MIKLVKAPAPQVLTDNAPRWTTELLNARASGVKPKFHYSRSEIKQALIRETSGKCAYCETKILATSFGDCEHIVPKSLFPERTYDWENMTLSCTICNNNKRDFFSQEIPVINPYVDDPESLVGFRGPLVIPLADDERAECTIDVLDLQRPDLLVERAKALVSLRRLLKAWRGLPDGDRRDVAMKAIARLASPDAEFSGAVRAYLRADGVSV